MTTDLSIVVDQMVALGWPCNPHSPTPPCWYTIQRTPGTPIEQWSYETPLLVDREGVLFIYTAPGVCCTTSVTANGTVGGTVVTDRESIAQCGVIDPWPGLPRLIDQSQTIYRQWAMEGK